MAKRWRKGPKASPFEDNNCHLEMIPMQPRWALAPKEGAVSFPRIFRFQMPSSDSANWEGRCKTNGMKDFPLSSPRSLRLRPHAVFDCERVQSPTKTNHPRMYPARHNRVTCCQSSIQFPFPFFCRFLASNCVSNPPVSHAKPFNAKYNRPMRPKT